MRDKRSASPGYPGYPGYPPRFPINLSPPPGHFRLTSRCIETIRTAEATGANEGADRVGSSRTETIGDGEGDGLDTPAAAGYSTSEAAIFGIASDCLTPAEESQNG